MALAQDVAHRGDRATGARLRPASASALIQLDVTIVNVALPRLGQDLGGGISALQWIVDGYALVFSVLLLIGGFLGDRYGARRVYLGGIAIFAAASALCGLAPDDRHAHRGARPSGRRRRRHAAVLAVAAEPRDAARSGLTGAGGRPLGGVGQHRAGGGPGAGRTPSRARQLAERLPHQPADLPLAVLLTLRVPETPREDEGQGFDPAGQILAILALTGLTGAVIEAIRSASRIRSCSAASRWRS